MVLVPLFVDTMAKKIWDEIEKKGKTKTVKTAIKLSNALRKIGIDIRGKLFKDVIAAFGGRVSGIICGGAPLNPEHIKTFDNFGVSIWQGYGITECSPLVAVNPSNMYMKKIASVGYPISANTVKIDEVGEDGYGEILVKGDNVMLGYLDDEEATKEVMTEDGYFRTGDIGYLDGDGYIYITGRKKNVIILSNGKNIYPEEIEEYLYKIDSVKECVVIGRAESDNSEMRLTAVIHPDFDKFPNKSIEEIDGEIKKSVTQMNKQLPAFKHINSVELRDTEFEKTTSKKIIRYKVK
jgi:long-chain acyl-CoA synthetase